MVAKNNKSLFPAKRANEAIIMPAHTGLSQSPIRLLGFDTGGEVFLHQQRIFRGIYADSSVAYRQVLRICNTFNLFQLGIVATQESPYNPLPELRYDLVLEHERIPFITYPHEWTSSMLKDAALLHISLYVELGKRGLTIKDWHPYNILFKGAEPIFVDFASIIPLEELHNQEYLKPLNSPRIFKLFWDTSSRYFFAMYRSMFLPYFLFPLMLMDGKHHVLARTRMTETILNASKSRISEREVFRSSSKVDRWHYRVNDLLKKGALIERGYIKHCFLRLLKKEIQNLYVKPSSTGYTNYYTNKGSDDSFESVSNWDSKQSGVYEVLKSSKPKTVLDIGSNTGWYSILAARLGSNVVAIDVDENCADLLYMRAKQDKLPILPLVIDITRLIGDVLPLTYENEPSLSLIDGEFPLVLSEDKRFKCDLVLALALIHHLTLGKGFSFGQVVKILNTFTGGCLIVEFVSLDDKLITADPGFFPSFYANPNSFNWYTLENFVFELKSVFGNVIVKKSYPESRVLLVCTK